MTGPEHYREAERLMTHANEYPFDADDWSTFVTATTAAAQVHATLALAAATAYPAVRDYCGDEAREPREWSAAIS